LTFHLILNIKYQILKINIDININININGTSQISDILEERKTKLLGHIMRREESDPLKQVCFDEKGFQHIYEKRRIGRPRLHWVRETMKNTFSKLYNDEIYLEDDEEIIFRLLCAAENRDF